MTIYADIQRLEPGELVELFDLDLTPLGGDLLRFHGYTRVGSIWWQGHEYLPWALEVEGLERSGDSQRPTPTLRVGNIGTDAAGNHIAGIVTALCVAYDDLVGAVLTVHQTLGTYLDARNFSGGNPGADPAQELPLDQWYIEQKTGEDREVVEFQLSGALSFDGLQLPRRQVLATMCSWLWIGGYRGPYCGYTGAACYTKDDVATADPTLDQCGGRLTSCKLRFGATGVLNFGGFPAADMTTNYSGG